jgi:hypothetical protein
MLWLDAEAVLHFGEFRRLVPAIQEMNRLGTDRVERMLLSQTLKGGTQNDWLMLPAWQRGEEPCEHTRRLPAVRRPDRRGAVRHGRRNADLAQDRGQFRRGVRLAGAQGC